jgi:DNA-binding beta-propeller fold protein YncE
MKTFLSIIFFSTTIYCQTYIFDFSFGEFNTASSFHINPAGFIFISDYGSDEIYKYDTLGTLIENIGGYGWNEAAFDDPSDIFATPLNVYVSDKNNHRVQSFDKDLNFISQLSTRESENIDEQFGYPLSCATSNQGDLYILDSENKRIVKFDLFGTFIQNFGGYDWGNYSLSNPTKIAISSSNNIFVLDGKQIVVFDQYGNGISVINAEKTFNSIRIIFNIFTANTGEEIYTADLNSDIQLKQINLVSVPEKLKIVDALIFNQKLYLLSDNEIIVFKSVQ